jgi:hypothetical protein
MSRALFQFLFLSFRPNSLLESDKIRRFVISVKAADALHLPLAAWITFMGAASGGYDRIMSSAEVTESLKSGDKHGGKETNMYAPTRRTAAWILPRVQRGLVKLTTNQFGDDFPRHLQHGRDSVLIANLIHISHV